MEISTTVHAVLRLASNISFESNEILATNGCLQLDYSESSFAGNIPLSIPAYEIYNAANGRVTIPTNGLYTVQIQGSFSNVSNNAVNGVYFRLPNSSTSNARIAGHLTSGNLVSTQLTNFMQAGDVVEPVFYSSDVQSILLANDETYLSWMVPITTSNML